MALMQPKLIAGSFQIAEPCSVPWEEMESVGGSNRFCAQCNKVIHEVTGMTEREIKQLVEPSEGKICVSVELNDEDEPILALERGFVPALNWKHWAVAASFFLLYQIPFAAPLPTAAMKSAISWNPNLPKSSSSNAFNTLVTAVLVNISTDGEIGSDMDVIIRHKGRIVLRTKAVNGLLCVDLQGQVAPEDTIDIEVETKTMRDLRGKSTIKQVSPVQSRLAESQNLSIPVRKHYQPSPVGRLMRRSGCPRF